jgi:dTDP-4-dehydrorhamnose reductase
MTKIYMAGAGGMLGEAFYNVFKNNFEVKCTDIDLNETWLSYMDFRNIDQYRNDVNIFKPDWIFHLGAFTDLEYCEKHPDDTYQTNTKSVENAVIIANELKIPILYISTAGIFDGLKDVYDETDIPVPLGQYGNTKYLGEKYVQETAKSYLICRAGWMMGGGEKKDKKFIGKLMRQIKSGKNILHIVNDKDGTPTYTLDFAKNVKLLIEKEQRGLFNMVCGGLTGRLEVATELVRLLNLVDSITIEEVPSSFFLKEYYAERPACERLVNKRLNDLNLNIMRDWRVALNEYISTYNS